MQWVKMFYVLEIWFSNSLTGQINESFTKKSLISEFSFSNLSKTSDTVNNKILPKKLEIYGAAAINHSWFSLKPLLMRLPLVNLFLLHKNTRIAFPSISVKSQINADLI